MVNNRLKICHVASIDITVGFLLLPQLKFLMSQGYDVFAVCSPGKLVKDIETEGIKIKTILIKRKLFSPIFDALAFFKLLFYFKKEGFDIVHTHGLKPGFLGQLTATLAGVPIIINTVHGLYFTEHNNYFKRKFFILIETIAARFSDLIFSQNKEDIETIIKEKIAPPEKIKYLGNGIDVKKFSPERFSKDFILNKKKALGLPSDLIIIGTVGRLVKEKGYLDLLSAFIIVLKKYPNILLLAIGPEEKEKKDRFSPLIVKKYGLESSIKFLGQRQDINELYPLMDIFVLASYREGFPRSVIEAMVMAKPIVVTNIRGCREEIDNKVNGLMVPIKDPEKLAKAVLFFLDNPKEAKEMAKNAKEKATKEFDENLVFDKLAKGYKNLLNVKFKN